MPEGRYLLDTNAIISLLRGEEWCAEPLRAARWVAVSALSKVEIDAFPEFSRQDRKCFREFFRRIRILGLGSAPDKLLARLCGKHRLCLGDAIIAATALTHCATLVTADSSFKRVKGLKLRMPSS
jgi:hypothetical protein